MNLREELMERLARRCSAKLGGLSDGACAELLREGRDDSGRGVLGMWIARHTSFGAEGGARS